MRVVGLAHVLFAGSLAGLGKDNSVGACVASQPRSLRVSDGRGAHSDRLPRLTATLEAAMITSFTLVWVLRVAIGAGSRALWTALFASTLLTGAAWAVAESFRKVPDVQPSRASLEH
jgi:hypothetical protein